MQGQPGPYHGRLHFEHWEDNLTLVGTLGQCLSGYGSWGGGADGGQAIADLFDSVSEACRVASTTAPNGLIYRPAGTDRLNWSTTKGKDQPITLLGFGHMGAVAMGDRLTLPNYTRDLRWKGINFTRIWAIDQWVGQATDACSPLNGPKGPTPFPLQNGEYNLQAANKNFYYYLRRFVQSAADRGIVVQLSVFDRHGIIDPGGGTGGFDSSPYNRALNTEDDEDGRFPPPEDTCLAQGEGSHLEDPDLAPCDTPQGFILPDANDDFHFPYLARVARETGAIGNVMYEVINEALQESWPFGDGEDWQIEMAEFLKQNLPVSVVRDAFNEYLTGDPGNPLAGKVPDARQGGGDSWSASNAAVSSTIENNSEVRLGFVTPLTPGAMSGSLPFSQPALWTDLGVRATVTAASTDARVGVGTSAGHHVRLEVRGPENKIRVVRVGAGGLAETLLGEVTLASAASEKTIRLRILKDSQGDLSTEVIVDGEVLPGLSVPVGEISGAFSTAFFGTNTYFGAAPSVDNFEAAYFCDSPSTCGGGFEEF